MGTGSSGVKMREEISTKKKMYLDVFTGKSDYIPLAVKVDTKIAPDKMYNDWAGLLDPQKAIDTFMKRDHLSMQVDSDWIPVIESNFLYYLVPSIFGAEVAETISGDAGFKPFIRDIRETEGMELNVFGEAYEKVVAHIKYLRANVIEGVTVNMPRFLSTLDAGVLFRGGGFYEDILMEPELSSKFMDKVNEVTIKFIKALKIVTDEDTNSQVTIRGVNFPGIRLTGDCIVNLSPKMIKEIMFGVYDRFADEIGPVMLHYCTGGSAYPAPAGHVITTLLDCPSVKCVDNWHGYRSTFDEKGTGLMQNKISICTDLPPEEVGNVEKLMTENPFFSEVPRKGGRGIAATVTVDGVDEGKRLYDKWVNYFVKHNMR